MKLKALLFFRDARISINGTETILILRKILSRCYEDEHKFTADLIKSVEGRGIAVLIEARWKLFILGICEESKGLKRVSVEQ